MLININVHVTSKISLLVHHKHLRTFIQIKRISCISMSRTIILSAPKPKRTKRSPSRYPSKHTSNAYNSCYYHSDSYKRGIRKFPLSYQIQEILIIMVRKFKKKHQTVVSRNRRKLHTIPLFGTTTFRWYGGHCSQHYKCEIFRDVHNVHEHSKVCATQLKTIDDRKLIM